MISQLFWWFRRKKEKEKELTLFEITQLNEYRAKEQKCLKIFESIVGDTPLKEIDWIINNGFNQYKIYYEKFENRTITSAFTTKNTSKKKHEIDISIHNTPLPSDMKLVRSFKVRGEERVSNYITGGKGNTKLLSWDCTKYREYIDIDTGETLTEEQFSNESIGYKVKWNKDGVFELYENKPKIRTFGDIFNEVESGDFLKGKGTVTISR